MRRGGRASVSYIYTRLFCICAAVAFVQAIKYGVPVEINHWDTGKSPLKRMVDVTNAFGLKVLAEHNFLNDNNIAFSPYGLMGIMVALFEGVDGISSYQIQRAMKLPWNRNVMRVGFRDIHRTLKTYFIPEEGFLAGLALNNENITFNENYIKILRFYGFDLESEKPTTPSPGSNSTSSLTEASGSTTDSATSTTSTSNTDATQGSTTTSSDLTTNTKGATDSTTESTTSVHYQTASTIAEYTLTTSSEAETTAIPVLSTDVTQGPTTVSSDRTTFDEISTMSSTFEPTTSPDSQPATTTAETTIMTSTVPETTDTSTLSRDITQGSTTPDEVSTSNTVEPTTFSDNYPTTVTETTLTTTPSVDKQTEKTSTTISTETTSTTITSNIITSTTDITSTTTIRNVEELTDAPSSTTDQTTINTSMSPMQTTDNGAVETASGGTTEDATADMSTTDSMLTSTTNAESTLDGQTLTTFTTESVTSTTESVSTVESTTNNVESGSDQSATPVDNTVLRTLKRRKKSLDEYLYVQPPYVDYLRYRSFDVGTEILDARYGGDELFLANGIKNSQATYMSYDTVLEHTFLPHLDATAIRLPLDSLRYYLLVVLPNQKRPGEISRLLGRMARLSDLSDVYASLRPRRVRALVPSFFVKGRVTLTTDLQRLGIRNVFQPRQNDFTPMTNQTGVYVRNIEQAVSVAIRKYSPDETKNDRHAANKQRLYFSATYPFLYFVMDANIHVALMAGKLVDPLNTRIL